MCVIWSHFAWRASGDVSGYHVGMAKGFPGASRALNERRAAVVEKWLAAYGRSRLRLPKPLDLRELQPTADLVAVALAAALSEPDCRPGAHSLREAEKRFAFVGGAMGQNGASAFEVTALCLALRDVLQEEALGDDERRALGELFDWLGAVATEGYVVSRGDALRIRHREVLENGTPVVMITPDLPAALLLGDPDGVFGRLLLATVRVGAPAVVLDVAGVTDPASPVLVEALMRFCEQGRVAGRILVSVSGLRDEHEPLWQRTLAPVFDVSFEERFEDACERALSRSGLKVGPSSEP